MTESEKTLRELEAIAIKHGVEPQLLLDWLILETSANILFVKMLRGVEESGQFMQEVAGTSDLPMTEAHAAMYAERVTLLDKILEKELSGGVDELANRIRATLRPSLHPPSIPTTPVFTVKGSSFPDRLTKLEKAFNTAMDLFAELHQYPGSIPLSTQKQRDAIAQKFHDLKVEEP